MLNRRAKCKVGLSFLFFGFLIVSAGASASEQVRPKKELMVDMGKQYVALEQRMLSGATTSRLTDQDYQEMSTHCDALIKLTNEYAKAEGKGDLAEIAKSLAASLDYLKQQLDRKDPVVVVSTFGRALSFCAECHYQSRWTGGR